MHKTFTNILNQNNQCIKSLLFANKPHFYEVKTATNWKKPLAYLNCNKAATANPNNF